MIRRAFRPEEMTYDFARDVWVEDAFVRAVWKVGDLPEPERAPEPGRWFMPPARPTPSVRAALPYFAISGFGGSALCAFLLGAAAVGIALTAAGALSTVVAFRSVRSRGAYEAESADLASLENPEDPDVCLVEVTIYDRSEAIGADRGAVWFEGGRLLFSGRRTSFAIGGEDVLPPSRRALRTPGPADDGVPADALRLRGTGDRALGFVALRHAGDWRRQESRFFERLRVFQDRPPLARGPRQAPPFDRR